MPYVEADSDIAWITSAWRVLFERLSVLHAGFFPDSTTHGTHYDPGVDVPDYLFPKEQPNYANVGIAPEPQDAVLLPFFGLRDVTRRGLNCLTLLLIPPEISLIPGALVPQQERLKARVLAARQLTNPGLANAEATLELAITTITQNILQFLHAWEGFLREAFFSKGVTSEDENNLVAFEAGLSMAWLSWGITVGAPDIANATAATHSATEGDESLKQVWLATFADGSISRLQHQVGVLGTALTANMDAESAADASAATNAVKRSLEYWQRAVIWLAGRPQVAEPSQGVTPLTVEDWNRLRLALVEQTSIWQSLILGQQSIHSYNAEGVTQRVMQDVAVCFSQVAAKEGLFDTAEHVGQVVADQGKLARRTLGLALLAYWPFVVAIVIALLLLVAIWFLTVSSAQSSPLAGVGIAVAGVVGALGGWLGITRARTTEPQPRVETTTIENPADPASGNGTHNGSVERLLGGAGSLAGQAGSSLIAAFNAGLDTVRRDLAELGQSVGVSYPLVEYFVLNRAWRQFQADVDFMDKVVWDETDRRDEIMRVASAAFGGLGVLAMALTPRPKKSDVE